MLKKISIISIGILALVLLVISIFGNDIMQRLRPNGQKINSENATLLKVVDLPQNLKEKKSVKMLLIGDEIAQGYGIDNENDKWLTKFVAGLEQKYAFKIEVKQSASYSNNSFGAWADYMGETKKKDDKYDMAVLVLGKNEQKYDTINFAAPYEETLRRILQANDGISIMIVAENGINNPQYYQTLNSISAHYGLVYADMQDAFTRSGKYIGTLVNPEGYPNVNGADLYAQNAIQIFSEKIEKGKIQKFDFKEALFTENGEYQDYYKVGNFQQYFAANLFANPKINTNLQKNYKIDKMSKRYTNLATQGDFLETPVKASIIGLYAQIGKDCGKVKVYFDDFFAQEIDLYSPIESNRKILLEHKSEYGIQNIRLEVSEGKNQLSTGTNVNIFGVITNTKESDIK